jgi:hypothetical protein
MFKLINYSIKISKPFLSLLYVDQIQCFLFFEKKAQDFSKSMI